MKIGIIGGGNMGEAFVSGLYRSQKINLQDLMIYDIHPEKRAYFEKKYQIKTAHDENELAVFAELIVLCIKPLQYPPVLEKITNDLSAGKIVISIAPSYRFASLKACVKNQFSNFIVAMSNTAAKIGKACSAVCFPENIKDEDREKVICFFSLFGSFFEIKENQMPAFTTLIGSSPAIVYMLLEGLLQGAIRDGISQKQACQLAADIVLSTASMMKESTDHPARLRDNICSPQGTTIEGIAYLEKVGFVGEIMEAMHQIYKKSKED